MALLLTVPCAIHALARAYALAPTFGVGSDCDGDAGGAGGDTNKETHASCTRLNNKPMRQKPICSRFDW